jgi:hypothetical protein
MSFGKLYSYPVCTACDFTPPLLRGAAVNHTRKTIIITNTSTRATPAPLPSRPWPTSTTLTSSSFTLSPPRASPTTTGSSTSLASCPPSLVPTTSLLPSPLPSPSTVSHQPTTSITLDQVEALAMMRNIINYSYPCLKITVETLFTL